jgi:hypothetical protein
MNDCQVHRRFIFALHAPALGRTSRRRLEP